MCVCVCVCVCKRKRESVKEEEREGEREREKMDRTSHYIAPGMTLTILFTLYFQSILIDVCAFFNQGEKFYEYEKIN